MFEKGMKEQRGVVSGPRPKAQGPKLGKEGQFRAGAVTLCVLWTPLVMQGSLT